MAGLESNAPQTATSTSRPLDAALGYSATSCPVLPLWWPVPAPGEATTCACGDPKCERVAKHPLGLLAPHGLHDASTDPRVVGRWFGRYPMANIGIRTGMASGWDVIDVDGVAGVYAVLGLYLSGRMPAGPHLLARTGRIGGFHLYIRATGAGNGQGRRSMPAGLDYRGNGGYVVVPPSVHVSGNAYGWEHDGQVLEPDQVRAHFQAVLAESTPAHDQAEQPVPARLPWEPAATGKQSSRRDRQQSASMWPRSRTLSALARYVSTAPVGSRNEALFWASCRAGERVQAGDVALTDAIEELLLAAVGSGLGDVEAERTILSGLRTAAARR